MVCWRCRPQPHVDHVTHDPGVVVTLAAILLWIWAVTMYSMCLGCPLYQPVSRICGRVVCRLHSLSHADVVYILLLLLLHLT